jgi:dTDP-4-amino-4,6-dideoxy-D-galactose acyltransferase
MQKDYVHLQWDSDCFGFNVARITSPDVGDARLTSILQELRANNYHMVYWDVPSEYRMVVSMAQKHGGILIDEKITYAKQISNAIHATQSHSYVIAPYLLTEPEPTLISLALESGMYSRFKLDPYFPTESWEKLYTRWITRAVRKEIAWEVLVVKDAGDVLGVVTLGERKKRGAVGLLGVAPNSRGMGIGTILISAGERCFAEHGYADVQIVTQRANTAACRLYESCEYQVETIDNVFHFWLQ